jgi:hypothetical protein
MSDRAKLVVGIATILPLAYVLVFFVWVLHVFVSQMVLGGEVTPLIPPWLFIPTCCVVVWAMGLTVFYYRNVNSNARVPSDKRPKWTELILFGSIITMPVYWYLFLWRQPGGHG